MYVLTQLVTDHCGWLAFMMGPRTSWDTWHTCDSNTTQRHLSCTVTAHSLVSATTQGCTVDTITVGGGVGAMLRPLHKG
jgi:hypothetical protein